MNHFVLSNNTWLIMATYLIQIWSQNFSTWTATHGQTCILSFLSLLLTKWLLWFLFCACVNFSSIIITMAINISWSPLALDLGGHAIFHFPTMPYKWSIYWYFCGRFDIPYVHIDHMKLYLANMGELWFVYIFQMSPRK